MVINPWGNICPFLPVHFVPRGIHHQWVCQESCHICPYSGVPSRGLSSSLDLYLSNFHCFPALVGVKKRRLPGEIPVSFINHAGEDCFLERGILASSQRQGLSLMYLVHAWNTTKCFKHLTVTLQTVSVGGTCALLIWKRKKLVSPRNTHPSMYALEILQISNFQSRIYLTGHQVKGVLCSLEKFICCSVLFFGYIIVKEGEHLQVISYSYNIWKE